MGVDVERERLEPALAVLLRGRACAASSFRAFGVLAVEVPEPSLAASRTSREDRRKVLGRAELAQHMEAVVRRLELARRSRGRRIFARCIRAATLRGATRTTSFEATKRAAFSRRARGARRPRPRSARRESNRRARPLEQRRRVGEALLAGDPHRRVELPPATSACRVSGESHAGTYVPGVVDVLVELGAEGRVAERIAAERLREHVDGERRLVRRHVVEGTEEHARVRSPRRCACRSRAPRRTTTSWRCGASCRLCRWRGWACRRARALGRPSPRARF